MHTKHDKIHCDVIMKLYMCSIILGTLIQSHPQFWTSHTNQSFVIEFYFPFQNILLQTSNQEIKNKMLWGWFW